ncbi:type I-F CRISPR-associated protein Csy3 [Lampropedia puyangensis]|uniref:Type I-F CRISPR-associated protein Csy3 n=1 Tax=Lampropedia puyangensis TaxID=1330072 RepID=A0A4S8FAW8_9BURK|nr:type I-F CRISPR-associated protein Csy3 [Lampropedia puyangensis]THU03995.1 type I-F CRISPR-associated protein Csy3 [Lampropedia puyangensis]
MATSKKSKDPSSDVKVLSVMRGINVSDAPFTSIGQDGVLTPIPVMRHGIRGTQNVAKGKADVSNIQTTESAKTAVNAQGVAVDFSLQPTPIRRLVTACDNDEVRRQIDAFLLRAETSEELLELCRRYARRILTGSFLWRNLELAHKLEISAQSNGKTVAISGDKAFQLAASGFGDYCDEERTLASWLQQGFVSEPSAGTGIRITAKVLFATAGAFEIYPSQVYVSGKPKGFARPLYKLNALSATEMARLADNQDPRTFSDSFPTGIAAIRDQKIGNAIRTIDTWYAEGATQPIAIEPNGASLSANRFFREVNQGKSFFDLRPQIPALTEQLHAYPSQEPLTADAMFVLAVFIRGGVFSDGKKESGDD